MTRNGEEHYHGQHAAKRSPLPMIAAIVAALALAVALAVHIANLLLEDIWPKCWGPLPEIQ